MHPAIQSALTDARETELRSARRVERPAPARRRRRRLAAVVAAAVVVVSGAVAVSNSSAAAAPSAADGAAATMVHFQGARLVRFGEVTWQDHCPVTNPDYR
jgi:hypothetical protein